MRKGRKREPHYSNKQPQEVAMDRMLSVLMTVFLFLFTGSALAADCEKLIVTGHPDYNRDPGLLDHCSPPWLGKRAIESSVPLSWLK